MPSVYVTIVNKVKLEIREHDKSCVPLLVSITRVEGAVSTGLARQVQRVMRDRRSVKLKCSSSSSLGSEMVAW